MPCSEINKTKLKSILQRKIFKKIDKPKELWRAVKPFGLPSKKVHSQISYIRTYISKKVTKYALIIKQMQMV